MYTGKRSPVSVLTGLDAIQAMLLPLGQTATACDQCIVLVDVVEFILSAVDLLLSQGDQGDTMNETWLRNQQQRLKDYREEIR